MNKVKTILARMLAVAIATALGTIGGGAVLGLDTAKTAALAAIMAIAVVSEDLARRFIADGQLTMDEINQAFAKVSEETDEISAKAVEVMESFRAAEDVSVDSDDHADVHVAEEVEGH